MGATDLSERGSEVMEYQSTSIRLSARQSDWIAEIFSAYIKSHLHNHFEESWVSGKGKKINGEKFLNSFKYISLLISNCF